MIGIKLESVVSLRNRPPVRSEEVERAETVGQLSWLARFVHANQFRGTQVRRCQICLHGDNQAKQISLCQAHIEFGAS